MKWGGYMKNYKNILSNVGLPICVNMLLSDVAYAKLSMDEREKVQAIVVSGEVLAFIVAVLVIVFVWNISKRDIKKRDSKEEKK